MPDPGRLTIVAPPSGLSLDWLTMAVSVELLRGGLDGFGDLTKSERSWLAQEVARAHKTLEDAITMTRNAVAAHHAAR